MSETTLLTGFLIIQVVAMAALAGAALRHAYRRRAAEHEPPTQEVLPVSLVELPPSVKQKLFEYAEDHFRSAMTNSTSQLQRDLDTSSQQVNDLLMRLATQIVSDELARYRQELADLHAQIQKDVGGVKQGIDAHRAELQAKMAAEIQAEKMQLVKQIDTKLGDAMASFLSEALGRNIDLGNQTEFLVGLLEEHKADFVKEVSGENVVAK